MTEIYCNKNKIKISINVNREFAVLVLRLENLAIQCQSKVRDFGFDFI